MRMSECNWVNVEFVFYRTRSEGLLFLGLIENIGAGENLK